MTATIGAAGGVPGPAAYIPRAVRPLHELLRRAGVACEVVLTSGETLQYGNGQPEFRIRLNSDRALSALDELAVADAYVDGQFEIELDMGRALDVRMHLTEKLPLIMLAGFWVARMFRSITQENRFAVQSHYSLGDDLYLSFTDRRWRFYSHGIFEDQNETIEQASEHKLERMYNALQLRPGMRLLDVGAGWGGVEEYCGMRGVHVTGLTIAPDSHRFVSNVIREKRLNADVRLEDFLEHVPRERYDGIVIYGVIEHIPNYRRFVSRVWDCLVPGGRLYLDASASREKYAVSAFSRRYIWPGTHTFLCLQDLVRELVYHGMDVIEVRNETRDYELTMRQWAERLDAAREEIIARWSPRLYRAFRLYLWGGSRAFHWDLMQAYSVVAEKRDSRGPRPGLVRRTINAIKGLV